MVNEVYHQLNSKKCPARRRYRWGINFEFSERQNTNLAAIIVANWRVDFASSFSLCHFGQEVSQQCRIILTLPQ